MVMEIDVDWCVVVVVVVLLTCVSRGILLKSLPTKKTENKKIKTTGAARRSTVSKG